MKHGQLLAITFVLRLTYSGQAADDPPPLLLGAAANGICLYNASAVVEHQLAKIAPGLQNAGALDYWLKEKTIVWADVDAHTLHIWKYDGSFEGKSPATVFTNNVPHVDGVAIDWVHGLLFRTDYDLLSILVTDFRSMRERVLLSTDLEAPRAIAVDPSFGVIFWSDWGTHRIECAGMDGQDRQTIASGDQVHWPNGLTLDLPARRVYWVEANGDISKKGIYSSDYWGRDVRTVTQSVTFSNPYSIAVYGDWLYWTEVNRHQVLKASKEGGHVSMVVSVPLPMNVRGPWGVRVVHSDAQPESESVCRNSKCERLQLCLPMSRLGKDAPGRRLYSCLDGAPANESQSGLIKPMEHDTKEAKQKGEGKGTAQRAQPEKATYPPLLLAANTNGIALYNQSAGTDRQLVKLTDGGSGVTNAVAVDYWLDEKMVVWSDLDAHKLYFCKYDDSFEWNVSSTAVAPHVDSVAIDWVHGLLFRTDFDLMSVLVTDLRSMRERVLLSTDMEAPRAIAVDPSCGTVFWTDWGAHRIERAGMDGQDRKVIASGDQVHWPNGLTLDLPARRVYWVEANGDTSTPKKGIYSSDYWGGDVRTITQSVALSKPFGITLHGDRLYWTEFQRNQVLTASKDGGHVSLVVNVPSPAGFRGPWGVRVFHPDAQPPFTNVCNLTDCTQLCLPTSRLGNTKEQQPSQGRLFSCLDGALSNTTSSTATSSPKQPEYSKAMTGEEQANPDSGKTTDKKAQGHDTYPPFLIAANTNGVNLYSQSAGVDRQLVKLTDDDPRSTNVVALDYWLKEKVVVWSDVPARTLHIRKYEGFFNWTKTARVYAPHTDGVAIDWIHGLLFRADFDLMRIFVMDLRLKHRLRERALISTDLEAPRAIAVDPSCGIIFWSDWGAHRIERAGMDGKERVTIASGDQIYWPNGLALDIPARRIYWVEANTDTSTPKKGIYSADYWGHDLQTVSQSVTFSHPFAIALYGDRLFWTDMQRHQVLSALKKGGQSVSMVLNVPLPTTMRGPGGLRVFHPDAQPQFKNVCSEAKCDQLCLPTSQLGSAKGQEPRDSPLYSCLEGVSANVSSQSLATNPLGNRGNTTQVQPEHRETAKEVAERRTEAALSVILIVIAVTCVVVAVAALFVVWYQLRRRNQRRKRVIIELSATRSGTAQPSESARDKWHIPVSQLTITIECQIGSGAFANVYKGRHGTTIIAVKIPREHSVEARRDIEREIEFMKALGTHSHILKLHGYSELEGSRSVLLLEYCANGDLSHWLLAHPKCLNADEASGESTNQSLPSDKTSCEHHLTSSDMCMQLLSFSWQISDGMAYLASRSLIHRDIAARNILLTDEMAAKISDFGMCRRSDGNMYSTKFGKLPIKWMAPESLKAGHFSHKSDIWSYGMLLYELFAAGQIPLSHVQPQEQLAVLERGDRPLKPDNCTDEIYALMQRCWRINPSQRPAIKDLMKDLERIIDASAAVFGYLELCASSDDIRPRSQRYALYRRKPRITGDEAKTAVRL